MQKVFDFFHHSAFADCKLMFQYFSNKSCAFHERSNAKSQTACPALFFSLSLSNLFRWSRFLWVNLERSGVSTTRSSLFAFTLSPYRICPCRNPSVSSAAFKLPFPVWYPKWLVPHNRSYRQQKRKTSIMVRINAKLYSQSFEGTFTHSFGYYRFLEILAIAKI